MFIDASAIAAVLLREPGYEALVDALIAANEPLRISPCVRFEATLAIAKTEKLTREPATKAAAIRNAAQAVDIFVRSIRAVEIDVTPEIGGHALEASARFGKSVGHRAALNFGDCLSYACASARGESLLFVGNDFPHTDIVPAIRAS